MPGPWDGPVRLIDVRSMFVPPRDAGRASRGRADRVPGQPGDEVRGSCSRSSPGTEQEPLVNLLYHRLRVARAVQAHMWISFLERVVKLAGGRMTGGIDLETERVEYRRRDR